MSAEILLTFKLHNKLFADPRRIQLLKAVAQTGSISQAAKQIGISYKTSWDAINEMNQLTENNFVERSTGGKGGGGASLTKYGQRLIQLYDLLSQIQQKAFDVLQNEDLPLDSLLAAMSRLSLQTSARNQLFATIESINEQSVMTEVTVKIANSQICLNAALTHQSAQRLQLAINKEVLLLIKAPWISVTKKSQQQTNHAIQQNHALQHNELNGQIISIQDNQYHGELTIDIGYQQTLCATLKQHEFAKEAFTVGQTVFAQFNAESIIIATLL